MGEFGLEGIRFCRITEIAVALPPRRDRPDNAINDLSQRRLPFRGAELSPEVLLGKDVGGVLRPTSRHLDIELLKGHRAITMVGEPSRTALPRDRVVGVDPLAGEATGDPESRLLGGKCHSDGPFEQAMTHESRRWNYITEMQRMLIGLLPVRFRRRRRSA